MNLTGSEFSEYGAKQSFLCDFAIFAPYRRKGYASEALAVMEHMAREAGCEEIVLFVSGINPAARALYEKCGYFPTQAHNYGTYMKKQLI